MFDLQIPGGGETVTSTTEIKGWCALCRSRCGATFTVEDGVLIKAGPAPDHPTGKALCLKGKAAPEILYSSERLLYPLRRTNPKGANDPGWERISWQEALNEISSRVRDIKATDGAEAIAFSTTTPSGSSLSDADDWIERLIRLSGSPNWVSTTEICNWHKDYSHALTFGTALPYPDYENADLIILWGFNPSAVWLDQAAQIADARRRGARILVIDPRKAGFGLGADQWLRVRPGADGVLALALTQIILKELMYDDDFVRKWSNAPFLVKEDNGEWLRAHDIGATSKPDSFVCVSGQKLVFIDPYDPESTDAVKAVDLDAEYHLPDGTTARTAMNLLTSAASTTSLDEAAALTWIDAEEIRAAARLIGNARSVVYYTWTGLGQHSDATQIDRALATLMSLTGSYDSPGGNVVLPSHPTNSVRGPHLLDPNQMAKSLGIEKYPLGPPKVGRITAHDFYEAVIESRPYPVKSLIAFGGNLCVAHADSDRGKQALEALDFYVHCDMFENPSAACADLFLPVATQWEREALRVGFGSGLNAQEHIQYRQRTVEPLGESRSDIDIVFLMAEAFGLSEDFFDGDVERGHNHILEPLGLTVAQLREYSGGLRRPLKMSFKKYAEVVDRKLVGFNTETHRVELYSALLARHGQPGVPMFDTSRLQDNVRFPYVLTTAKAGYFCHSQHRQIPSLRKREKEPSVSISPQLGSEIGLEKGDWAELSTAGGSIRMQVLFDDSLDKRVVQASYGWWQQNSQMGLPGYDPFAADGANYNRLVVSTHLDPVSGTAPHRSQPCSIAPISPSNAFSGFIEVRVRKLKKESRNVTRVVFESIDGIPLPDYLPGQHLTLRIGNGSAAGALIRCYSLIGPAKDECRTEYQIAVRSRSEGREDGQPSASSFIATQLREGDRIHIRPPKGSFVIPLNAHNPMVLIAGGIGITPFLSFLQSVAEANSQPVIHLIYACKNGEQEAFVERLKLLRLKIPSLTISRYWSQVDVADDVEVRCGRFKLSDIPFDSFPKPASVYFCGPLEMGAALRRDIDSNAIAIEAFFEENFASATNDTLPIPAGPYEVKFIRSGRTLTWSRASGSILEMAERSGLSLPSGCRAGQCESCALRIVSGDVSHLRKTDFQSATHCLACLAVPSSRLVIDA